MNSIGIWILQLLGAFVCCIMIYIYVEYRISLAREKRSQQSKGPIEYTTDSKTIVPVSGYQVLESYLNNGYMLALDVGVLSKYPQLTQVKSPDSFLITEEISTSQKSSKVVGIQQYTFQNEAIDVLKHIPVNSSYVSTIGLDPDNISNRAIGTYLYAEKTNLINIVFVTLDQDTQNRAINVGLKAELV